MGKEEVNGQVFHLLRLHGKVLWDGPWWVGTEEWSRVVEDVILVENRKGR